jgi:endonuclease/exonuclease/phosphatase family metal-dependent hydrolase
MAKILVWNVENFGAKNQNNLATVNKTGGAVAAQGTKQAYKPSNETERINAIVNQVRIAQPDIFVLMEVMGEPEVKDTTLAKRKVNKEKLGYRGCVMDGAKDTPLVLLAETLREKALSPELKKIPWCLVPPRFLANTDAFMKRGSKSSAVGGGVTNECVAVFFNPQKVQFAGPYENVLESLQMPTGKSKAKEKTPKEVKFRVPEATATNPQKYRALWAGCLPEKTVTLSGYALDLDHNSTTTYPPECNMPFVTRFVELATEKHFDLVTFHASRGQQEDEHKGTKALLEGLRRHKKEGVAQIVVGDFNEGLDYLEGQIEDWQIAFHQGQSTYLHNSGDLLKGQFPNYGFIDETPIDNAIVPQSCQFSTMICNPFVGYPYDAKTINSMSFKPSLNFHSFYGKPGIESMIENKEDGGMKVMTAIFHQHKNISNHLPFVINVDLKTPQKK